SITPNIGASAEGKTPSATGNMLDSITGGTGMTVSGEKTAGHQRGGGTVSIGKSAMPKLINGIKPSEPQLWSTTAGHALVAASPLTSSSALTPSSAAATGIQSCWVAIVIFTVG